LFGRLGPPQPCLYNLSIFGVCLARNQLLFVPHGRFLRQSHQHHHPPTHPSSSRTPILWKQCFGIERGEIPKVHPYSSSSCLPPPL
jgi:hypothetical protein